METNNKMNALEEEKKVIYIYIYIYKFTPTLDSNHAKARLNY